MALSLVDAIIETLESSTLFTTAFGDTWDQQTQTGVAKIFADMASQVPFPYVVITETGESYEYMTRSVGNVVNYMANGQLLFDIFAEDRYQVWQLGGVLAKALNDSNLYWPGENVDITTNAPMYFRMASSQYIPTTDPAGPGVPIVYHRQFMFMYTYSGEL